MESITAPTRSIDLGIFLWNLLNDQSPQLNQYQWPRESARWHELVFCLLLEVASEDVPPEKVRIATRLLVDLDLLDVENLAQVANTGNGSYDRTPEVKLISAVLQRIGFDAETANIAIKTICEAAESIQRQYNGRLQQYLRQYGQLMLNEVGEHFNFSNLSKDAIARAFSHWLQNVLNMPISASSPSVLEFCDRFQTSIDELMNTADERDINLAIVDDLIQAYMEAAEQTTESEIAAGGDI